MAEQNIESLQSQSDFLARGFTMDWQIKSRNYQAQAEEARRNLNTLQSTMKQIENSMPFSTTFAIAATAAAAYFVPSTRTSIRDLSFVTAFSLSLADYAPAPMVNAYNRLCGIKSVDEAKDKTDTLDVGATAEPARLTP